MFGLLVFVWLFCVAAAIVSTIRKNASQKYWVGALIIFVLMVIAAPKNTDSNSHNTPSDQSTAVAQTADSSTSSPVLSVTPQPPKTPSPKPAPWSVLRVGQKVYLDSDSYTIATLTLCPTLDLYFEMLGNNTSKCFHLNQGTPAIIETIVPCRSSDSGIPCAANSGLEFSHVKLRALDGSWNGFTESLKLKPNVPAGTMLVLTVGDNSTIHLAAHKGDAAEDAGPDVGNTVVAKLLKYDYRSNDRQLYVRVAEGRHAGQDGWTYASNAKTVNGDEVDTLNYMVLTPEVATQIIDSSKDNKREAVRTYLQPIIDDLSKTRKEIVAMQAAAQAGSPYDVKDACEDGAQSALDAYQESTSETPPDGFVRIRADLISGSGLIKGVLFACQDTFTSGHPWSMREYMANERDIREGISQVEEAISLARQKYVELGGRPDDAPDLK